MFAMIIFAMIVLVMTLGAVRNATNNAFVMIVR
jgi:hypothetical protein